MARVTPLAADANPDLQESFGHYAKLLGYVPNSVLIMQHKPKMVKALALLAQSVWDPASKVPLGFKRLVAYMASRKQLVEEVMIKKRDVLEHAV